MSKLRPKYFFEILKSFLGIMILLYSNWYSDFTYN